MEFSEGMLEIINKMVAKHNDRSRATDEAEKLIRKLPEFNDMIAQMVHRAIQELVDAARSRFNQQVRDWSPPTSHPKVVVGSSPEVQMIYSVSYRYRIAGTILGELYGRQLGTIASAERNRASGYLFNARLCERLMKLVPEDKKVQETVSEKKLRRMINQLQEEMSTKSTAAT